MKKETRQMLGWMFFALFPYSVFQALQYGLGIGGTLSFAGEIMNTCMMAGITLIFTAMTGKTRAGLLAVAVLNVTVLIINSLLTNARYFVLSPYDLLAARTALSVAHEYKLKMRGINLIFLAAMILLFGFGFYFSSFTLKREHRKYAAICGVPMLLVPAVCSFMGLGMGMWTYDKTSQAGFNGLYTSFLFDTGEMMRRSKLESDEDLVKEVLSRYSTEPRAEDNGPADTPDDNTAMVIGGERIADSSLPDIIIVMDEAFGDISLFSDALNTPESGIQEDDYIPYVRSILNGDLPDTQSGILNVSVNGGYTVNTEWEFLTGNTMRFMPAGSIPFLQYIDNKTDFSYAIPSYLNSLGYRTTGIHPYNPSGYHREAVWTQMGINEQHFGSIYYWKKDEMAAYSENEDFSLDSVEFVRDLVSDKTVFERLEENLDNGKSHAFAFVVTMQNHGGYDQEPGHVLTKEAGFTEYFPGQTEANTYISLQNITDRELPALIDWVDNRDRDTILAFFGDHQASISIFTNLPELHESEEGYYQVPFFIHANYDLEEKTGLETSVNFLGGKVLRLAGIPLTPYQRFLEDVEKKYPVVSGLNLKWNDETNPDGTDEVLSEYENLVHYFAEKEIEEQSN